MRHSRENVNPDFPVFCYNVFMTIHFNQYQTQSITGTAPDQDAARFDRLIGASPWLIVAYGEHSESARDALEKARAGEHHVDLILFDKLDDFDSAFMAEKAGAHRHIIVLCAKADGLTEKITQACPAVGVVEVIATEGSAKNAAAILNAIETTPRCC